MKFAFFPGCVAKGAAPELYISPIKVAEILGIELDEKAMESASCTGAGVGVAGASTGARCTS